MTHRLLQGALAPCFTPPASAQRKRWARLRWRAHTRAVALAAGLLLAPAGPGWSACSPAGGWPGAPRAASPIGSVLDGLGMLGPLSRAELALTDAMTGSRGNAVPECAGSGSSPTQAEPASLPSAGPERSAGNPFDVVTGGKHEHRIDLALPAVDTITAIDAGGRATGALEQVSVGESLLLQFSRFYSSANAFSLSLGPGWSHSFDTRLARRGLGRAPASGLPAAELQLLQADGRRITMQPVTRLSGGRVRYQGVDLSDGVIEEDPQASGHPWVWRWPSGRRLVFDTRGRLSQVQAPDLDRLELGYDEQGRLVQVEDRHGRAIGLIYQAGRLTELRLPDGQSIRYAYDGERRLIGVRYPDGRLVQHHYEDAADTGRLTGTTEPDGRRSRFRYQAGGRIVASVSDVHEPDAALLAQYRLDDASGHSGETELVFRGASTRYRWRIAASGEPTLVAAEGPGCPLCPSVAQTVQRDVQGRPVGIGIWRLVYDTSGRVTSLARGTDAEAPVWRFSYPDADPLARPAAIDAPGVLAGRRRHIEVAYNDRGQIIRLVERGWAPYFDGVRPVARAVRVIHAESGDLAGKRVALEQLGPEPIAAPTTWPAGGAAHPDTWPTVIARTEFRYDRLRRLEAVVHPESIIRRVERDTLGRPVRETLADGLVIARRFDTGWQLARLDHGARVLEWLRDRQGRLSAMGQGAGRPVPVDHPVLSQLVSDHSSRKLGLNGIASQTTQPTVPGAETQPPGSLPLGLLIASPSLVQVDADGRTTETRFDDLGRVIEERSAQRGVRQVFHDARGHPVKMILPDGSQELREFDAAGRLLSREQVAAGGRISTRFLWTGMRLVGLSHPEHDLRAMHDEAGRLSRLTHRLGMQSIHYDYRYDVASRLSERSLGDGFRLRYEYDASGRPYRLGLLLPDRADPVWLVESVDYQAGNAVSERLGAGVRALRRFDSDGRLASLDWRRERGGESLARFEIRRRDDGLVAAIERLDGEERFGFDAAGRLIVREWQRAAGATLHSFYHYSPGGDLRLLRDEAGRTEPVLPTAADPAGRPLRHGPWLLGYGASGRIERAERSPDTLPASEQTSAPASAIDYRYNALGERVLKRVHGPLPRTTRFLYHQNALVAELDAAGRITRHFIRWQGRVVAIVEPDVQSQAAARRGVRAPAITWLLADPLGTPQMAVDQAGRPVWQARLGAYGEVIEEDGRFDQPLRLPGQYHDRETGLHDNYQRTFDPRHGRYLEPDPLGLAAGWNLHAYAAGNPVQATDPLGLILFAFDGTGNSDPANGRDTLSNVAKFFSLHDASDRHYMSGVGTLDRGSGIGADAFDTLQALSARRRVDHMLGVLDRALRSPETRGAPVNVDVIGFSRGAAMARDFANTVAARISSGHYLSLQRCVSLNFIGLWDTVAQFGLNGQANAQWNLGVPPQARVVVHAVALNEQRRFFPLESIGPDRAAPAGGWRLERGFIGDHGDIGGSHPSGDLSDVALGWMVEQARKAGVGLKALDVAWQTVTEPMLHDARSLLAPGPDREFRLPLTRTSGERTAAPPASQATTGARPKASADPRGSGRPMAQLGAGLDRSRAEAMIRRYPYLLRGRDGAATLAGTVDMSAYSTWLAEHYALNVQH